MCSSNANSAVMLPFGLKIGGHSPYLGLGTSQLGLELHRARVQEYTQRIQLGMRSYGEQVSAGAGPLSYHSHVASPYMYPYFYKDPRARFIHEEPKPNHSYIGLIAMAILSVRDKKLVLSDIYQWILDNYSYFRTRGPGWRNSIRHNLSLNDCFIKSGRSANGKGHYWAIHPANIDDFQKGDFRRRRAQRRVRKHMGLSVADDEDDDSPVPSPTPVIMNWDAGSEHDKTVSNEENEPANCDNNVLKLNTTNTLKRSSSALVASSARPVKRVKRQFDMASLLAPDVVEETETVTSTILVEDTHETENAASSGKDSDDGSCENENENKLSDSGESHTANNDHTFQPSDYSNTVSFRETTASETETNHSNIYSSIPHLLTGYQRNADAQQRVSAFRHAGSYNWGQLSGCLPNYIGSGFGQQLSARQFNSESARRLQEAMANLITRNQDDRSMPVNTADD